MAKTKAKKRRTALLKKRVAAAQKKPASSAAMWSGLKPGPANYTTLSPIVFLPRAALRTARVICASTCSLDSS